MVVFNKLSGYDENGKLDDALNMVYQMKDSWLVIVLHKTNLGRIAASFPSICILKTNGSIYVFGKKKQGHY